MIASLDTYFPDFEQALMATCTPSNVSDKLLASMQYSLQGKGKRIRPLLVMLTCDELGGDSNATKPIALALECIHTYSLIHDDLPCMDDDDLRRGMPTNHIEFGQAHAVLAGDALLTLAFETLSDKDWTLHAPVKVQIIREIAAHAGHNGMVGGQALDIESEAKNISSETLQRIHAHKTGALIRVAIRTGALVATSDQQILSHIDSFAQNIGLAFQIADDILDVTQSSDTLGKTAGSDQQLQKSTYPSIFGLEQSRAYLSKAHQNAIASLDALTQPCPQLRALADYIITRTR